MRKLETKKVCIYYGDCPFNHSDCQEDEPWFVCPDRQITVLES